MSKAEVNEAQHSNEQVLSMKPSELAELVRVIVQEAKRPDPLTPAEIRQMEQQQEQRLNQSDQVKAEIELKAARQNICTHLRKDGTARIVYVQNQNYLLCQKCRKIIRPEKEPELFNELFQLQMANNQLFD
jgi:hypothetical protein